MTHILLLAALKEEANAFLPGEGVTEGDLPHPVRNIVRDGVTINVVTCGLGKVNAALAVGYYIQPEIELIAMIGTCGRIDAPHLLREANCFWIARAIQHDYGARAASGFTHYRAGDWPMGEPRDFAYSAMPDPGSGLPHASIISGDIFLECSDTAAALAARLGAQLVDMEVAAMAQAAEALGLPWCAIKAATDDANGGSVVDFSANLRSAARLAGEAMAKLIQFR